jgi:aryl carrier-like protein
VVLQEDDISGCLADLCARELKKPIAVDRNLLESGLSINRALRIIRGFWLKTGIELDVNCFYVHPTIGSLARAISDGTHLDLPKLIEMKSGSDEQTLVIFAGGVSCFLEMQDLVGRLDFPGRVFGMALTPFQGADKTPALVSDEIACSVQTLRSAGLKGPYRFLGYSFGGVFALELARALEAEGEEVAFLGLIDTPQSQHSWRFDIWLRFVMERAKKRFQRAGQRVPREVSPARPTGGAGRNVRLVSALGRGFGPLLFRFADPRSESYPTRAPQWIDGCPPRYEYAGRQLLRMKGLYRPAAYGRRLAFYRALGGSPVDCDPKRIWMSLLPQAEWIDVRGNHQSVIVGQNATYLAADLRQRLTVPAVDRMG